MAKGTVRWTRGDPPVVAFPGLDGNIPVPFGPLEDGAGGKRREELLFLHASSHYAKGIVEGLASDRRRAFQVFDLCRGLHDAQAPEEIRGVDKLRLRHKGLQPHEVSKGQAQ